MANFEQAVPNHGFDGTARPPWFMVGTGDSKLVVLVNGPNLVLKSQDEHIAEVAFHAFGSSPNRRNFSISGRSPGPAFIEAFSPGKRVPDLRLAVRVKAPKTISIAFHYVKDDVLDETRRTRTPQFLDDLVNWLDATYAKQANVTFTRSGAVPVEARTTLFRIVREQTDLGDPRDQGEFQTLALAGDSAGAEINVFFMPWPWPKGTLPSKHPDRRPTEMFGTGRTCICEDAMTNDQVRLALPHMVARLRGCQVTHNEKHKDHVMFFSRAEGLDPTGGFNGGFLPRDCSDRMNPG